jgi:hypothetical protein
MDSCFVPLYYVILVVLAMHGRAMSHDALVGVLVLGMRSTLK